MILFLDTNLASYLILTGSHLLKTNRKMGVESIRKLKEEALLPKKKKVYFIPKISKKKQKRDKEERDARNGEDTELQKWYKRIIASEEWVCWNCNADLGILSRDEMFSCVAHVLPKSIFPSV